jgi:pimeloyl-ACP methyl ester carboxylesterase
VKLAFRKYGEAGPPLIIVHGLYGASDNWVSIARELEDRFEVFAVDQRNHGESPHDGQHTYEAMRDDLREFMDDQGIDKAVLLGHSMGGKTVMAFAMAWPERVESLIVVDIAPIAYHDLAEHSQMTANHAKMIDAMLDLDLDRLESREDASRALSVSIGSERIRLFLLKNLERNKDQSFHWKINLPALKKSLDEIMGGLPTEEHIKKGGIKGFPAFFVRGENSDYIRPEDHDTIKKLFPTAEIVSIPSSGHWVHAEQPDLLVKNLKYFLG